MVLQVARSWDKKGASASGTMATNSLLLGPQEAHAVEAAAAGRRSEWEATLWVSRKVCKVDVHIVPRSTQEDLVSLPTSL